jgi:class 3 adenylate cyclase
MDVADWLRALGLERYAAAFRENDVTAALLPNLTADDLKDLGVALVGHRRQILDAIAELRIKDTPAHDPTLSASPAENLGSPETTPERRPISVMFCDLVGSTALSSRLDPEGRSSAPARRASPPRSSSLTASLLVTWVMVS